MLSPASQVGLILEVLSATLRPLVNERLADPFALLSPTSFAHERKHLDTSACLLLLKRRPNAFVAQTRHRDALKQLADALLDVRNKWAHQDRIDTATLRAAARNAADLLGLLGDQTAGDNVRALLSPQDELAVKLRSVLTSAAKRERTLTYSETNSALGLSQSLGDRRKLYTHLTASGAVDKTLGAPLLCSIVVLSEEDVAEPTDDPGIPGGGYYWLVGLDRSASRSDKRRRHAAELRRVYKWHAGR